MSLSTALNTPDELTSLQSYDATSHFETVRTLSGPCAEPSLTPQVVDDVRDVWKRITGGDLVFKKRDTELESQ